MDIPQKTPKGTHINWPVTLGIGAGIFVLLLVVFNFSFYDGGGNEQKEDSGTELVNFGEATFLNQEPDSSSYSPLGDVESSNESSTEEEYVPPPPEEVFKDLNPTESVSEGLTQKEQVGPPPRRTGQARQAPPRQQQSNQELQEYRKAQQSDGMVFSADEGRGGQPSPYENNPYSHRGEPLPGEMQGAQPDTFNRANHSEIDSRMTTPKTAYTIMEGYLIPATLETGISSKMPGNIRAFITRDVYDSITMEHLLIPRGSTLIGSYDERVVLNQSKLILSWERLIYPDGRSIYLPDLNSYDLQGRSGLSGKVNRHFWRKFGQSALLSLIGVGINATAPQQQGFRQDPSLSNETAEQIAQDFNKASTKVLERNMQMAPTIKIPAGKEFNIFLAGDISFPEPYNYSPPSNN